jgi:hypothetical protein
MKSVVVGRRGSGTLSPAPDAIEDKAPKVDQANRE